MRVKGGLTEESVRNVGRGAETLGKHDGVSGGRARGITPRRG